MTADSVATLSAASALAEIPALALAGFAAVFVALALVVLALAPGRRGPAGGVARSLAAVEAIQPNLSAPQSVRQEELDRPLGERVLGPAMALVVQLGRRITPTQQAGRIRRRLDMAGNPSGWDVDRVVGLKLLLAVLGLLLGLLLGQLPAVSGLQTLGAVGLLALLGWFAPSVVIYQLAYERTQKILKELPDAIDLMTITVESGLSFDAALSQVARNAQGPLAGEFARVLQEMQIGTGRGDALRALGERTDIADLQSFVGALVQADGFGVPISKVLRIQSEEIRARRGQRVEEAAQRVPVKILFPLIFGVMPALFVVVIGPAAINLVGSLG